MLKTILIIALIGIISLFALFIYAACVAAWREDRAREYMYEQWAREHERKNIPSPLKRRADNERAKRPRRA